MTEPVRPASELRSLRARLLFGSIFTVPGLLILGVGLRVVEVVPATVHAPYWLISMLGGMFAVAGLWLFAQGTPAEPALRRVVGPAIVLALLTALHWVAFGPGARQCSGGWSIPFLSRWEPVSGLECRMAFGYGAVLFDGVIASALLSKLAGTLEGAAHTIVDGASKAILLLAIAPLIPVLLVLVAGKAGVGWVRGKLV